MQIASDKLLSVCGRIFLRWQTVGLLNYFKMADLFITEDLHNCTDQEQTKKKTGTYEEENRREENDSW